MAEIAYRGLADHLKAGRFSPIYLIYGEEVLYKSALDRLLDAILPPEDRGFGLETVDGDNVHEAIERVSTFSLMAGKKVVALTDSRLFESRRDDSAFLAKARDAWAARDPKKASRHLMALLGKRKLALTDLPDGPEPPPALSADEGIIEDGKWLVELIAYCREHDLTPTAPQDRTADLERAIAAGIPEGHHLVITAEIIDRRRSLYKVITEHGTAVDCSLPTSNRKADRAAREAVISERFQEILGRHRKRLDPAARRAMEDRIGLDLRTLLSSLEKLVHFVGDRNRITPEDVSALLSRTRQDPVYALTGAVAERDVGAALFYVDSLLSAGFFPLQVLTAVANQVRRLIAVRGFLDSPAGRAWNPSMPYPHFQDTVLPEIRKHDETLLAIIEGWETTLTDGESAGGKPKAKGRKAKPKKPSTDLTMAAAGRSPYPIYLALQSAGRFTVDELVAALGCLSEADRRLKSSGMSPRVILDWAVHRVCRGAERAG